MHVMLLIPMLGLTEHPHFPSDRYGVMVGMIMAALIAAACASCWRESRQRWIISTGSALAAVFLSVLSAKQLPIWTNNSSFFDHLLTSLKDHPFRFNILCRVAFLYRTEGSLAKAENNAAQALEVRPTATLQRIWLGDWQMLQGKKEEARQTFITGINLQPLARGLHARLGQIYLMEGRMADAAQEFAAELHVSPPEFTMEFRYFLALARSGNLSRAETQYVRLRQTYGLSQKEELICQVAVAEGYAASGEVQKAVEIVARAGAAAQKLGFKDVTEEARIRFERWRKALPNAVLPAPAK
jgi:tetratricopeptide (TPR) repeat protein